MGEHTRDKRKFTLYLSSDENDKLAELRVLIGENNDAKAIKTAIKEYSDMMELNNKTTQYLKEERERNRNLESKINNFREAFKELLKD